MKITFEKKITFENLERFCPKFTYLPPEDNVTTNFWEDLYRLFKARMIEEQTKQEIEG